MERLEYVIRFNTPAFLGNAFQKGQWRTPPFKALLRQWWRVVKASEYGYDYKKLREAEGKLFGHAWLTYPRDSKEKKWAVQGQVKVRLSKWSTETLKKLPKVKYVCHPEVNLKSKQFYCKVHNKNHLIDPLLYLGYGAILGSRIKDPISTDDKVSWTILARYPNKEIEVALKLIHLFGTIGGRCRNGWGSIDLSDVNGGPFLDIRKILDPADKESRRWLYDYARDWKDALNLDWCHAIGKDKTGLLFWRSKGDFPSWKEAMRHLAEVKIALRTQFHFKGAGPHSSLCDRHILAYPIGGKNQHLLRAWGRQNRSANQLFFKVHRLGERYVPIVVHIPHGIPEPLKKELKEVNETKLREQEEKVWQRVHEILHQKMQRLP